MSPGCLCAHCYAETWALRYDTAVWGEHGTRRRTSEANWAKPLAWERAAAAWMEKHGHRRRVFCASLADVFEPRPELEPWRAELFDLIEQTPSLDWLLLTKRPDVARDRLHEWYTRRGLKEWTIRDGIGWGMLPNIWLGTSIENARHTYRAEQLRECPAAIRFLSCEPLLGSLFAPTAADDLDRIQRPLQRISGPRRATLDLSGIDWVIVGGESGGRDARPMHPAWAREIRDAVTTFGVDSNDASEQPPRPALHIKQWGSWRPDTDPGRPEDSHVTFVALSSNGKQRSRSEALIYPSPHTAWMRYCGPAPTAGGKLLDGADWCEFPDSPAAGVPAGGRLFA